MTTGKAKTTMKYITINTTLAALTLMLTSCAGTLAFLRENDAGLERAGKVVLGCVPADGEMSGEGAFRCVEGLLELAEGVTGEQVIECAEAIRRAEQTHSPDDQERARSRVEGLIE